jgi:aryl-alcohol dehydrogenase-like predicted oxidoreductase
MQQREMGHGGATVGAIGLGCMSFAQFYGPTDRETSLAALQRAADLGVTHLDTAIAYGNGYSEEVVGEFTSANPGVFHVASKCGIIPLPTRHFNNKRDYVRSAVEGSLTRLRTDCVDLYYLHRRDPEVPIETAMETMAELVAEGMICGVGLSEVSPATLERAMKVHPVAAVQSEYSLWTRLPELGLVPACERLGVALVAFSPLARGLFGDDDLDPSTFGPHDFRRHNPRFSDENFPANLAKTVELRNWCRERGWTIAAVAVAWGLARSPSIISIPGTRTAAHLEQFVAAAGIHLGPTELAEIDAIMPAGWAHGARYSEAQNIGPEQYC